MAFGELNKEGSGDVSRLERRQHVPLRSDYLTTVGLRGSDLASNEKSWLSGSSPWLLVRREHAADSKQSVSVLTPDA